jgi:hypothetical protein
MAGRVAALDAATLRAHRLSRGPGFHLVEEILFESEEAYLAQMKAKYARARKYPLPGLAQALAEAGVNLPY